MSLTDSSSLLRSLLQERNSSYLAKGTTGSGSSLKYSLSREATVCTSVLLRGGEKGRGTTQKADCTAAICRMERTTEGDGRSHRHQSSLWRHGARAELQFKSGRVTPVTSRDERTYTTCRPPLCGGGDVRPATRPPLN